MSDEVRPDPEALLKAVKEMDQKEKRGVLKIFLGMAAGVGKTYAMLEEAQKLQKLGVDVQLGVIDTHGREETAALLADLPQIPLQSILYKEKTYEELNLDKILELKPKLVLVDELAHTNIPGSRHAKRWQDVMEILDKGIDVSSTLNVQHIESLKEPVEFITDIVIHETVPDIVIEAATHLELVDITPRKLLERLKEGKVYLGDKSEVARHHFFKEDRLTALREMALRFAAEKVEHDLQGLTFVEGLHGWKTHERLLVGIRPNLHGQRLIRTTKRLAFNLNAPWICLHVNDGNPLSEEEKALLDKNFSLARDLGAEVITTNDSDVAAALERVSRQRGVTQLIVGRPPKTNWFMDFFSRQTFLLYQLMHDCEDLDIHVIRKTEPYKVPKVSFRQFLKESVSPYVLGFLSVAVLAAITWFLSSYRGYPLSGVAFLLGIIILTLLVKKGPLIAASLAYVIIWNIFFIPSQHAISPLEYNLFFFIYTVTAIWVGYVVDSIRLQSQMLEKREVAAQGFFEISRALASHPSLKEVLPVVKRSLEFTLGGKCEIILKNKEGGLNFEGVRSLQEEKEHITAKWAYENDHEAGWSTTTFPTSKFFYLPLKSLEVLGVIAFQPYNQENLTLENKNFLYRVSKLLANHISRTLKLKGKSKEN